MGACFFCQTQDPPEVRVTEEPLGTLRKVKLRCRSCGFSLCWNFPGPPEDLPERIASLRKAWAVLEKNRGKLQREQAKAEEKFVQLMLFGETPQ
jgi:hypothetical protein